MAKKSMIRFSSNLPFLNLYPIDFENLVTANMDLYIQTTWGDDIRGTVMPIGSYENPEGYKLFFARGTDCINEEVGPIDAVTIFTGKGFSLRKMNPPRDFRNAIPFAIGMNRAKRQISLNKLKDIANEQFELHNQMLKEKVITMDAAFCPVQFDYDIFHAVTITDSCGQYSLADGFYFLEGYPDAKKIAKVLEMIPEKHVDLRRVNWIIRVMEAAEEDRNSGKDKGTEDEGEA